MRFVFDWIIQNPVQTIDSGTKVIFDSEPILLAATIITFLIVAFFVWNKNKVKLYKMVENRKPMEPVKFDREDILELKSALGKANRSELSSKSHLVPSGDASARGPLPPKERTKTSGEAEIDGVSDSNELTRTVKRDVLSSKAEEPPDELVDWFVEQYTDDKQEQKEMKSMENLPTVEKIDNVEQDNKQHTYQEKKIDKRKTPEFKARLLENLRKAREKKRLEKAGREVPEKP